MCLEFTAAKDNFTFRWARQSNGFDSEPAEGVVCDRTLLEIYQKGEVNGPFRFEFS